MSLMSRIVGWWGCSNCSKMHRRAQATERLHWRAAAVLENLHDGRGDLPNWAAGQVEQWKRTAEPSAAQRHGDDK